MICELFGFTLRPKTQPLDFLPKRLDAFSDSASQNKNSRAFIQEYYSYGRRLPGFHLQFDWDSLLPNSKAGNNAQKSLNKPQLHQQKQENALPETENSSQFTPITTNTAQSQEICSPKTHKHPKITTKHKQLGSDLHER